MDAGRADPPACRNCGAPAAEAYCPRCGQETALALPTARQFLKDAAGRYVALDGRTWRTLAALLLRPGFLTREYYAGRRRRYLRPSRLFLVLSLVLFAAMRWGAQWPAGDAPPIEIRALPVAPGAQVTVARDAARRDVADAPADAPRIALPGITVTVDEGGSVGVAGDGRLAVLLRERMARFNALPARERVEQVVAGTLRYGPYAAFALLPAFALLLAAVYAVGRGPPHRPRRYAEHLVFAAHNHAFLFLAATIALLVPWRPVDALLALWCPVYGLWATKAVYGGGWTGLAARALVLGGAYLALFGVATAGLVVAAVLVR